MSAVRSIRPELAPSPMSAMPFGLDTCEELAYRKGHARAMSAYVKKHGGPGLSSSAHSPAPGTPERVVLAVAVSDASRAWHGEHGAARDLAAHKAGMSALRAYYKRHGLADRFGPVKRATAAKPAAVTVAAPAPVVVPDPVVSFADVIARRADNKARNRELAEEMRAAGIPITVDTWNAAKSGNLAGIGGAA